MGIRILDFGVEGFVDDAQATVADDDARKILWIVHVREGIILMASAGEKLTCFCTLFGEMCVVLVLLSFFIFLLFLLIFRVSPSLPMT